MTMLPIMFGRNENVKTALISLLTTTSLSQTPNGLGTLSPNYSCFEVSISDY